MFGSYFVSIFLHIALALLIFLWPSSPPVKLDQPMMQISVNMGAPGGNRMPSPVLGPQGKPTPKKADSQPVPEEQAASAVPVAREDTAQPKAEPKKESQPKPKPKPEPKPDAVALAQKKEPKRPEPKDDEADKPKPKEKPKDDGKKDKKESSKDAKKTDDKATKPAKQSDRKKDGVDPDKALADALNDAKKKAGTSRGSKNKGGSSSVAGALADFQKSAGGAGGGGAGEGDGPGGGGIYDVYMGQVILAVRPNWSMPTYSRQNLSVQVSVKLDRSGKVLSCTVARSSGRAEVDASAVNAVIRTKVLPAPPTPEQQDLLLTFNTQEMMGRR